MSQIIIDQFSFQLSDPWAEGVPLDARMLHALRALRAENIRNNLAKLIRRASSAERQSPEWLSEIQARAKEMDESYEFPLPRSSGPRISALDRELLLLAEEQVAQLYPPSEEEADRLLAELLQDEELRAEAQRRVTTKSQLVLADLGLDLL